MALRAALPRARGACRPTQSRFYDNLILTLMGFMLKMMGLVRSFPSGDAAQAGMMATLLYSYGFGKTKTSDLVHAVISMRA